MYCPISTSFFGVPYGQRVVVSYSPTIQCHQDLKLIENTDLKNLTQSLENHSVEESSSLKSRKLPTKKTPSSKSNKKIKKSSKIQSRMSKKTLFKNSYLSFAVHKLMTFIENKTASQKTIRSLLEKFEIPEENLEGA